MTIPSSSPDAKSQSSPIDPGVLGTWPVYWINLDSRPDRAVEMNAQLASWAGGSSRIAAVAGATVADSDVNAYLQRLSEVRRRKRARRIYNPANEIGCLRSHCVALRTAMARGLFPAIVLEDDGLIQPSLATLVPPADWDVLLLGGKPAKPIARAEAIAGWARFTLDGWRHTVAYAVASADAARRLIETWEREDLPADVGWVATLRAMQTFAAVPEAVPHDAHSPSSIANLRRPAAARARNSAPRGDDWTRLKLALPARRALASEGIADLEAIAQWRRSDLEQLHGIGRNALVVIERALSQRGLTFASEMEDKAGSA